MDVLHKAQLVASLALLLTGLLLSSLESTIVSTALVSIANDFQDYDQSNWVVIAYLLTYSSFLIVYARMSDLTGRKAALLTGVAFFTLASLACGLARTLIQLIVFRAFQGIGGAGIYALTMVVVLEITPKRRIGLVSGSVNLIFVIASAIGPVIGGAITSGSTWRWCFYLNVPPGAIIFLFMLVFFPRANSIHAMEGTHSDVSVLKSLLRVDWAGLVLLLASAILLIIPLEEGGNPVSWTSAFIISMFVVGGICLFTFGAWQTYLARRVGELITLPLVPFQVALHRIIGFCILTSMMTGLSFTASVVYLPQRFQFVNDLSPVDAGTRILPIVLVSAFGNMAAGVIMSKKNLGSWFILLGNSLQVIGLGLSSTVPTSLSIPASIYGYQAILGMGLGTTISGSFLLARIEVSRKEVASAVGAITQLRLFGGVVGIAICRVAQNAYLSSRLAQVVSPATAALIQSSASQIRSLSPAQAAAVRLIYGEAFNFQWRILTYISLANIPFALMTFRRHAKSIHDAEVGQELSMEGNGTAVDASAEVVK